MCSRRMRTVKDDRPAHLLDGYLYYSYTDFSTSSVDRKLVGIYPARSFLYSWKEPCGFAYRIHGPESDWCYQATSATKDLAGDSAFVALLDRQESGILAIHTSYMNAKGDDATAVPRNMLSLLQYVPALATLWNSELNRDISPTCPRSILHYAGNPTPRVGNTNGPSQRRQVIVDEAWMTYQFS